jgi:hypothetical protein
MENAVKGFISQFGYEKSHEPMSLKEFTSKYQLWAFHVREPKITDRTMSKILTRLGYVRFMKSDGIYFFIGIC